MKRARKAAPLPKEHRTTAAVADALRVAAAPGWMWSHFPAGELRDDVTGAKLKRMGLKRGWSDFVLIGPDGVHHWLELKRGKASLLVEQEAFAQQLLQRGVPWKLARSFDEAIAVLTGWGAIRLTVAV
jgi:hypothetical protein